MGVTMKSRNYCIDFSYSGFNMLRLTCAELTSPEVFEHYKNLFSGLQAPYRETFLNDYNAKTEDGWRTLKESYRKYWEHIGCVQIPHHGSRYSFNTGFLEFKHCYYIVSAGNKSKFCHPHAEVMKSFLIADKRLYLASETGEQTLWVE